MCRRNHFKRYLWEICYAIMNMPEEGLKIGNRSKESEYDFSFFRKEKRFTKQMGEQTLK